MDYIDPTTLKPTGGFAAITPQQPKGPMAITKVVRGPNGTMQTIYVDAKTGQELSGLGGYTIWNSQNYLDPNFEQEPETEKPKETTAEKTVTEAREIGRGGRDSSEGSGGFASPKGDVQNNYGYINKPSGMGFASMLPGPLGMAAKAVNTGINMNNVSAVNEARKSIGLEDQGFMGRLGGTFKDKQGQVANVTMNDENYSVGFEAMSPTGRTNLTPQEARQRMNYMGTQLTETPKEQVKQDEEAFQRENPKATGFLADVKNTISSIFDSVNPFNDDEDLNQFPDAPTPKASAFSAAGGGSGKSEGYDGKSYSGQNAGADTPSERGPGPGMGLGGSRGETGASTSEANRGGGGVTSGGGGLW